uniref:Uncharacterized protein n=1 Tax=viral metagenome TaxID=1070528 RepID=A0A6C0CM23_9ZZZZ
MFLIDFIIIFIIFFRKLLIGIKNDINIKNESLYIKKLCIIKDE